MNYSVYKDLIDTIIDGSKSVAEATKPTLKAINDIISPFIPIEITEAQISGSTWTDGLVTEEVVLPNSTGTLLKLLPLYDGSFLAIFSDAPAIHYSSAFSLIGYLPFKYGVIATAPNDKNYNTPTDAAIVPYSYIDADLNKDASLLLIPVSTQHVVQVYKYAEGIWSYVTTVGTVDTAGNGTSTDLSLPTSVTGYFADNFTLLIGCFGAAASAATSFIKQVTMTTNGTKSGYKELSYPGQYLAANAGSLKNSETDSITRMQMRSANQVWLISETKSEFGLLTIGTPNRTTYMTSGDITALSHDDVITKPVSFAIDLESVYVADEKGHVAKLSVDLKTVKATFGKTKVPLATTTYPNEFNTIDDLLLIGDLLYLVSGSKVFKTTFPTLDAQSVTYLLTPLSCDVRIEKLYGLVEGLVEISIDGVTYKPLEYFALKPVPAGKAIYIRISRNLTDAATQQPLTPGILIVSF